MILCLRITFRATTPLLLPLRNDAHGAATCPPEPLFGEGGSKDQLLAAECAYQPAAKTVERPLLFGKLSSTIALSNE